MATTNLKTLIIKPGYEFATKIKFQTITANTEVKIPRRLPFADIVNYDDLKKKGILRHKTKGVSVELGGNETAGGYTTLGLQLPRTEQLILLAKNTGTQKIDIQISGNQRAGRKTETFEIPAGTANDIYQIDLFDMGFYIEDNVEGALTLTPKANIDLVLIARY